MNKILKYLLLAAGGIALILIALAAYIAATFNPNDYKPQIEALAKEKLDRTLGINGDIKLTFYPALGADLGGITLSERGSAKEFAAVDAARVALQLMPLLSREIVVSRIELRGLRANLVKRRDGSSNVDDLLAGGAAASPRSAGGQAGSAQKPLRFDIARVLIENAKLGYTDERSGARYALDKLNLTTGRIAAGTPSDVDLGFAFGMNRPVAKLDVRLKSRLAFAADAKQFKLDGLDLGIKGEAAGLAPLTLEARGELEGDAKAFRSRELVWVLDATHGDSTIKGKLSSALSFDVAAQTLDLDKLAANLSFADTAAPRGAMTLAVSGKARADLAKQRANLDFTAKLDESTIKGRAGLAHFSPPSYEFELDVDKLDVDRYSHAQPAAGQGSGAGKAAPAGAEAKLDFSALKTLHAGGSLRIGALKVANLKLQNVRVEAKAGGGRLELDPLAANLYQGSSSGHLSLVAAARPQLALKQHFAGISVGPLLKDAIDKDLLEGKGNVALDVSGEGATVSAIKKALNGSAAIDLADGALKGINIAAAIRNAKAKLGALKGETTQASNAAEKTDFSELKASFAIRNGVAHNSDLSLKSPLLRLGGEGNIDIGASSVDYLAKATLVASAAGQGGKEASELKGITVPVRISGPFASLSYKLDFGAMIGGAAKGKIEEKKGEIKSKLEDRLKGQLKGLFGR